MMTACKEYIAFFKNGKVSNDNPDCVIENPFFVSDAKYGKDLNIEITENWSDEYLKTFSKLHFITKFFILS